jgi:hypothetical protein
VERTWRARPKWTTSSTVAVVEYAFLLASLLLWAVPGLIVLITGMVLLANRRHRLPARTVRFGHAGFLVMAVTTLVGVAIQFASFYLWTMDGTGPDRETAFRLANMASGLIVTLGNVVGMALVVAALVARATPDPFDAQAGGFEPN